LRSYLILVGSCRNLCYDRNLLLISMKHFTGREAKQISVRTKPKVALHHLLHLLFNLYKRAKELPHLDFLQRNCHIYICHKQGRSLLEKFGGDKLCVICMLLMLLCISHKHNIIVYVSMTSTCSLNRITTFS